MFRALSRIWWLLALCGIVDGVCAALNLLMVNPDRSLGARNFGLPNVVWEMSILALVAGACAIAAGICAGRGANAWLLSLHGLGLGAFGLIGISPLVKGPLSFRPISLLFVLMAFSVGAFAWGAARRNRTAPDRWFLIVSGAASIGYAVSFVAVGFRWIRMGSPHSFWIWMSSYFGLCAIFMLYLALRAREQGASHSRATGVIPPAGSPGHAV